VTTVPSLWTKHRWLARHHADQYTLPGAERQDVRQEADIALWIACRSFDPDRGAAFKTFASLVITRRLATLVKAALAAKHQPLNDSLRVATNLDDETDRLVELLPGPHDTERVVVMRDTLTRLTIAVSQLTPLERAAVAHAANGERYADDKSVDNALTRSRAKLRKAVA
jgi:RNA polymerase sporulation-specific sigma factor